MGPKNKNLRKLDYNFNAEETRERLERKNIKVQVIKKPEYLKLEFQQSNQKPRYSASEDTLDLMRLAVDTDDKQWFNELSEKYNSQKSMEELVKAEIGFIG